MLKYSNLNAQFVVQTDASYSGIYKVMKKTSVGALEALAIGYAAKKLRQYVYDNPNVIVQTDHRSLQH